MTHIELLHALLACVDLDYIACERWCSWCVSITITLHVKGHASLVMGALKHIFPLICTYTKILRCRWLVRVRGCSGENGGAASINRFVRRTRPEGKCHSTSASHAAGVPGN